MFNNLKVCGKLKQSVISSSKVEYPPTPNQKCMKNVVLIIQASFLYFLPKLGGNSRALPFFLKFSKS